MEGMLTCEDADALDCEKASPGVPEGTVYGEACLVDIAEVEADGRVEVVEFVTSFERGEGRFGQFVQLPFAQTELLKAEQKACPALRGRNESKNRQSRVLTAFQCRCVRETITYGSSAHARHVFGSPEQGNLEPTFMSFLRNATPAAAAGCRC